MVDSRVPIYITENGVAKIKASEAIRMPEVKQALAAVRRLRLTHDPAIPRLPL